jgi:hypothetical protein
VPHATSIDTAIPGALGQNSYDSVECGLNHNLWREALEPIIGNLFSTEVTYMPVEGFVPNGNELWEASAFIYSLEYGSLLPEGVETHIGLRFDPVDGIRYGWVRVIRDGLDLDATAWGYETDPIPEPGSVVLIGVGAALFAVGGKKWL